jgi:uncharacterized YigZ family protein
MNADSYLVLAGPGHAQTRVLGSRFFGSALPISGLEEVNGFLEAERKRYHDATHWCWAARWGVDKTLIEKSTDAGEPHGTAGIPMLREIQKREFYGALVIVTRWFGGTKLGTGGLVRAYGDCAALALDAAATRAELIRTRFRVACPFDDQGLVYGIAHRFRAIVEPEQATTNAAFVITIVPASAPALCAALSEEGRGRMQIEELS